MNFTREGNTLSSAINIRSKKFWLILLFMIYSLFGWLIVPMIVKDQAVSNLKTLANWDTKIEAVRFNPWVLSLEIQNFETFDQQQAKQVAFESLYINVSVLRSLTGRIALDEISLSKPLINVDIDEDGQLNFQKAFASDEEKVQEADANQETDPIALFFGLIAVSDGHIHLQDRSLGETFDLSLQPLNLALEDFSTDHNDGGEYSLDISIGQGQKIAWKGQIGVAPFQSKGQLSLTDIQSDTFWYYVKQYSPYTLTKAKFSVSGQYDTEFSDARSKLLISNASFGIQDLQLAEQSAEDAFFDLKSLSLNSISFDLEKNLLGIDAVEVDTPQLYALKDSQGEINLLRPLTGEEKSPAAPTEETDQTQADMLETAKAEEQEQKQKESMATESSPQEAKVFNWSVAQVAINNGAIQWEDQSLETTAAIKLEHLAIRLKNLSQNLAQPFPYAISFVTEGQQHDIAGEVAPDPLALSGTLRVDKFPLALISPYIGENINAQLESGEFALNTEFTLKKGVESAVVGTITNQLALHNIHLKDSVSDKAFTGFDQFVIEPFSITLQEELPKQIVEVGEVRLLKPYSNIYINQKGVMNLAALSKDGSTEKNDESDVAEGSTEAENTQSDQDKTVENETQHQETRITVSKFQIDDGRFEFTDASQTPAFSTYFDQVGGSVVNLSSDIDAHSKVDIRGMLETYGKLMVQGTLNPLSPEPNSLINIDVENIDLSTASTYSARYAGYQIDKGKLNLDLAYELKGSQLKASNHVFIDQFEFGDSVDSPDATSLPLPLALGLMKNLDGEIDIDLPISGDVSDPSFSIGGILFTAFTNLITKVVTSPFSILGELVGGDDDISQVRFLAQQADIDISQEASILKLAEVLVKRPKLNLEIRGVADANIDGGLEHAALLQLAKKRAQSIRNTLIEKGNVSQERIFMLEPDIIALSPEKETAEKQKTSADEPEVIPYVSSVFTIGVN